jgi:Flp pilus assembly protein TadD
MEPAETQSLRLEIERRLRGAFDEADVLPRLARLARLAAPTSDDGIFANQKLAELLVERDPWRAALYVRRALAHRWDDDRPWAILAFCHTLLGNFRSALAAYKHALACAPSNPWYAHNLGHLLDVALGEPARALDWLKAAYAAKADNSEIVASYVHALARAGQAERARDILERARERFDSRELDALLRWLDEGAPRLDDRPGGARRVGRGRTTTGARAERRAEPPTEIA